MGDILCVTLVMNGQLFTRQNTILWIGSKLKPECRGCGVVTSAFGEQSKLTVRARANFGGKAEIERLRTSDVGAAGIPAATEETGEAEKIEAVYSISFGFLRGEKCIDL